MCVHNTGTGLNFKWNGNDDIFFFNNDISTNAFI